MPHWDINVDLLAKKQSSQIQQYKLETLKLYEERKKILDKYVLTGENAKEYATTLEQIKKIKDIPSKGEYEKSLFERIMEFEERA